jgi:2-phospho-L-lactate transferase/gluconeogenesis factor (CofD/UPF0052 family)
VTVAVNGYDDGASTGEVRRFLVDALGPSDFRKNASRLASALSACEPSLVQFLDARLPDTASAETVASLVAALNGASHASPIPVTDLPATSRAAFADRLAAFLEELGRRGRFDFKDCSVGNLVFAGGYLRCGRRFNAAVDDYAGLVGLAPGVIENVTDGTNAFLVAIDVDGRVLGSEADIVDAKRRNTVQDIFLIDRPLDAAECAALAAEGPAVAAERLATRTVSTPLNSRLAARIAEADLIVYAPGTQHSSLLPSYLTPGLSGAIAANLRAIKLLITNIQTDAEITGRSAVDIVNRAVFFLKEKGKCGTPTPALITHFLINDPRAAATPTAAYVPLGRLDTLQDPRLVRIGQYEEGGSGRHDALKVLGPFLAQSAGGRNRHRVAIVLYDAGTTDKLAQTLLEMVRGGISDLPVEVTVFCETAAPIDAAFLGTLPFPVRELPPLDVRGDARLRELLQGGRFEYVLLFESSGMYNGEDVPWLASHLTGRLDAVWGSRRLSVRDIEESYRLRYDAHALAGVVSYIGSHLLSLLYLGLYGRYVSDTLSGARALRVADACAIPSTLTHKRANQHLLTRLLRRKAEMFEVPVHFFAVSPAQVKRTTAFDGLQSIGTIIRGRLRRERPGSVPPRPRVVDPRQADAAPTSR